MTLTDIKAVGYAHGLPPDYCLRGTKRQIANQIVGFFVRVRDYAYIASDGKGADIPALTATRDAVRMALAGEVYQ